MPIKKIFILCLFLTACEFKDDNQEIELKPFSKNEVQYRLIALDTPNKYTVEIKWPKTEAFVFLKKEEDDSFVGVEQDNNSYRINFDGGTLVEILLEKRDQKNNLIGAPLRIGLEIPRDWEITSLEEISEDRKMTCGRLFLSSGGILRLKNFNLELRCNELISNSGIIETFPSGAVAKEKGGVGASGGMSVLSFKKARGILYLNLRGENGADGRNGLHGFDAITGYFPGCRGQNGGDGGAAGNISIIVQEPSKLEIAGVNIPGKGGRPGKMIAEFEDREAIRPVKAREAPVFEKCVLGGGDGVIGKNGEGGAACLQINAADSRCL